MTATSFVGQARYVRKLPRPIDAYTRSGASTKELIAIPEFVTPQEMSAKLRGDGATGKHGSSASSRVHGLTVTNFSVEFEDQKSQWRQKAGNGKQWEFIGGKVFLVVKMSIFVLDWYKDRPDLVKMIMDHEMLHVKDEINIVTRHLPPLMPKQDLFKKYLIDKAPVDEGMYRRFTTVEKMTDFVFNLWAEEHNKRGGVRDSGKGYQDYGDTVLRKLQNQ